MARYEIVGKIVSVGGHVTKFKVGDLAAVGCMVDSCRECDYCKEGRNNTVNQEIPERIIHPINTSAPKLMEDIQKAL
jgi:threonine dehydrogenase-like Zn-dependent dehydrogenase